MKEDGLDGRAEATTADAWMAKAADTARGIVEKKEIPGWRESSSGSQESLQQRRSLRWIRSESCCCVAAALLLRVLLL